MFRHKTGGVLTKQNSKFKDFFHQTKTPKIKTFKGTAVVLLFVSLLPILEGIMGCGSREATMPFSKADKGTMYAPGDTLIKNGSSQAIFIRTEESGLSCAIHNDYPPIAEVREENVDDNGAIKKITKEVMRADVNDCEGVIDRKQDFININGTKYRVVFSKGSPGGKADIYLQPIR